MSGRTSTLTPRNILKPTLAMTSAVSAKVEHCEMEAFARNSSTMRTPIL